MDHIQPRRKGKGSSTRILPTRKPSETFRTNESLFDATSLLMLQEDYSDWCEECISEGSQPKPPLTRTMLLILDYKQFKAARVIQKYFRRWYCQRIYQRKRRAASMIQRQWRFFLAQRVFYCKLETTLQQRIEAFYFRKAQMIQALWRGYWSRANIHDHNKLMTTQVATAEELLQCIAFKLHHMLRTYQIPGVYSLRNSHCLSRVEKLMACMSFKQHNDKVRLIRNYRQQQIAEACRKFQRSAFSTPLPYGGPNGKGYCDPKCESFYEQKDVDRRMFKILSMYEEATKDLNTVKKIKKKRRTGTKKKIYYKTPKPTDFCADIVNSMKRWRILNENSISVDPNIFRRPSKLDSFLHEIESIYDMMQKECVCGPQKQGCMNT